MLGIIAEAFVLKRKEVSDQDREFSFFICNIYVFTAMELQAFCHKIFETWSKLFLIPASFFLHEENWGINLNFTHMSTLFPSRIVARN